MTLEKPQNEEASSPKMLLLDTGPSFETKILGKQDPVRGDQQGSVSLACCTSNPNSNFTSVRVPLKPEPTRDERVPIKPEPMRNVQAIFLGFGRGMSDATDLKVYINSESTFTAGKLIKVPHDWPCFWSWADVYDAWWFALDAEQPSVSSMSMCVENTRCEMSEPSGAMLISMAVY
jgi:hypothetical protein